MEPAVAGIDGEPAAHLPGATDSRASRRAAEVEPVGADRQRSATAERRRGQQGQSARAGSWREALVDLLQVAAVGIRFERLAQQLERAVALAELPAHVDQVRRDLGVLLETIGSLEVVAGGRDSRRA